MSLFRVSIDLAAFSRECAMARVPVTEADRRLWVRGYLQRAGFDMALPIRQMANVETQLLCCEQERPDGEDD